MQVSESTMENLMAMRLSDLAGQVAHHIANGDIDLAIMLNKDAKDLAAAYDEEETILVAEALF